MNKHKEACEIHNQHIWTDDDGWVVPYCKLCGIINPDVEVEVENDYN